MGGDEKRRKAGTEVVGRWGRGLLELMVSRCVIMAENLISTVAICHVYPQTTTGINEIWEEVRITVVVFLNFVVCVWFSFIKKKKNCNVVCVTNTNLRLN